MTPSRPPSRFRDVQRGAAAARWPLAGAQLLVFLVACMAMGPLLRGTVWWWLMALVAAVVLVSAALARTAGVKGPFVPLVTLGTLLATTTLLFGGGTGLLWLIPTPETFTRFGALIGTGTRSIDQQSTPAEPIAGILFLLFVGAGLLVVLMDVLTLTLRMPALAGIPALVPLVVPGVLLADGAGTAILVFTAVAFLVLLRLDVYERRASAARSARTLTPGRAAGTKRGPSSAVGGVLVGGIGLSLALVLSLVTPVLAKGALGGGGSGALFSGVSPMIDLGQDLRRPEARAALHYRTTAEAPPYLKILTLDRFEGTTWVARNPEIDPDNTVDRIGPPTGLGPEVTANQTRTAIVIDGVNSSMLPAPAPATSVRGLRGDWFWTADSLTIASSQSSTLGQRYTVLALELAPTADQLREASGEYPASVDASLDLPRDRPAIIDETAQTVTAGAASTYDAALALQEYLRGNEFRYDTNAPVDNGYDGSGLQVLGTFLEVKEGYCVHFASAMAVMARALGIPARIAIGYLPGTRATDIEGEGLDRYNVDSHDLHSWPELYFAGVGWVPFEPTPSRGSVPDYARPASAAPTDAATSAPTSTSTAAPGEAATRDDGGVTAGAVSPEAAASSLLGISAGLSVALTLLLVPLLLRRVRRSRRLRLVRAGEVAPAWAELSDTALDYGILVPATDTPRSRGVRLAEFLGEDLRLAVDRMVVAVERHRFARLDTDDTANSAAAAALLDDLTSVLRAFPAASGRGARWRALLLPASLFSAALDTLRGTGPGTGSGPSPRDA